MDRYDREKSLPDAIGDIFRPFFGGPPERSAPPSGYIENPPSTYRRRQPGEPLDVRPRRYYEEDAPPVPPRPVGRDSDRRQQEHDRWQQDDPQSPYYDDGRAPQPQSRPYEEPDFETSSPAGRDDYYGAPQERRNPVKPAPIEEAPLDQIVPPAPESSRVSEQPTPLADGSYQLPRVLPHAEPDKSLPAVVIVDKRNHETHVLQMQQGRIYDVLKVPNATGKTDDLTPEGHWHVADKRLDPVWTPPVSIDPEQNKVQPWVVNPSNPLGKAFIRLDAGDGAYGLHGTNRPDQIGFNVSHGCMRHLNEDIMKVYPLVEPGSSVYIVKRMNGTAVRLEDFYPRPRGANPG